MYSIMGVDLHGQPSKVYGMVWYSQEDYWALLFTKHSRGSDKVWISQDWIIDGIAWHPAIDLFDWVIDVGDSIV